MSEADKFREILENDPSDTQAFVSLCHIAGQDGDFEYLADLYKFRAQIIKDTQEIADLFFKAGEVYIDKLEDVVRGVEALLQGFEYDKCHAGIGDRLDAIYRDADDWEATGQILDQRIQALEEMDQHGTKVVIRSDLHQQLGEIWERVYNDLDKAMKNYRKAIELDRSNLPALYSARELCYASGKYKNAAKFCELEARAEKDTERRVALYRELGHLLNEHLSDPDQAVLALKRALKLEPENADTKLDLAQVIARTPITEASEKNHRWASDFLLRAAKKAEPAEALEFANLSFIALPDSAEALSFFKSKAMEMGATDRLEEGYKTLIEIKPELEYQAPHIRRLAKLYVDEIGDPEKALEWLRKLEPLGLADDKKAISQLSKGVETRASQMPPPADTSTQPETVEEAAPAEILEASKPEPEAAPSEAAPVEPEPPKAPAEAPKPAPREAPPEPPEGMSNDEYVTLLHKDADKARRSGDDASAEERMLQVLDYKPQDQKAMTYLERRFRARSDWGSLRDVLLRSDGAAHLPQTVQTVRLREAARISEEQLGDANGAIDAWKLIRQNDPKVRDAGDALARLLAQAERWDELLEIVAIEAETTKSRAKRIEAYRRIADINRIRLGNSQAATEAFQKVLELSPDDESALEALDEMYLRDQNYEELVSLLKKRAELSRDREVKRGLLVRAVMALRERLDMPEDAYTLAKEVLAISPNDNEVLEIMESVDEEGEHWGRLLNTLDLRVRAASEAADKAHLLRKKSAIAIEQFQDTDAAIKALRDVLDVIPDDFQAMDQLTEIYSTSGEWEELVEIHEKRLAAVQDEHDKAEILKDIARILENNLDKPDEALKSWRKVIDIEEDVESLGALLRHYERNEEWAEIVEVQKRQSQYAEDYKERADLLFNRAEVLFEKLGQKDDAVAELKVILAEVDPTNASTLALLRQIYVEDGNFSEAADLLDQQIEHTEEASEKKELLTLLGGWAKKELDDMERASDAFEKAAALDPSDAELLGELDEVYTSGEAWDKLLDLIQLQYKAESDDEEKLDLLVRGAKLCEETLDDSEKAWTWYRLAFNQLKHLDRTLDIVDEAARRMELWQQLIDEIYGVTIRGTEDVDEQVEWWLKIATVFEEKLDDVGQGLEAILRAFGLAPENRELLDKVDHLAVLAKNWQRLSTVYGVLASRTEEKEGKIELLVRYAELLADQEEQVSQAFDISLKAFELDPTSEDLLGTVEVIGEKAQRWDDMVRVYSVCLRFVETNEKKAELMLRAAAILRDKQEDPDGAVEQILGMLRIDPFDEEIANRTWTEIQALEEDLVSDSKGTYWNKLIDTYRTLAEENSKERLRQAELLSVVARIYSDEMDDVQAGFDSLKEIQQLNPRDEDAINRLEALASEHDYWDAVTEHYQDILDETFEMEIAVMYHKRRARILEEELGLPEEASEHYWQIIQLDVSDMNGYEKLLDYYRNAEKWNELVNLLERQLDNTKDDEDKKRILLHIASIWENNINNKYEAKDWYNQIITMWPDNEEAKEGLDRLMKVGSSSTDELEDEDDDEGDDDIQALISIPPPPADESEDESEEETGESDEISEEESDESDLSDESDQSDEISEEESDELDLSDESDQSDEISEEEAEEEEAEEEEAEEEESSDSDEESVEADTEVEEEEVVEADAEEEEAEEADDAVEDEEAVEAEAVDDDEEEAEEAEAVVDDEEEAVEAEAEEAEAVVDDEEEAEEAEAEEVEAVVDDEEEAVEAEAVEAYDVVDEEEAVSADDLVEEEEELELDLDLDDDDDLDLDDK